MLAPELHEGRFLWIDRVILDKINNGCDLLGWEGDDRLAVFLEAETEKGPVWGLYRYEENGRTSFVVRTEPGIPFDDRIIHWLCANDSRGAARNLDLDKVAREANDAVDAEKKQKADELIAEELAPRLRHALLKDGM